MSLTKCGACGAAMSKKAAACPACGHPNETANHLSGMQVLGGLALAAAAIWWMANRDAGTGLPAAVSISGQVARDAVKEYEIAKRGNDPATVCAQASIVTAAYLQANMEAEFKRWQEIEQVDCRAAGVSP